MLIWIAFLFKNNQRNRMRGSGIFSASHTKINPLRHYSVSVHNRGYPHYTSDQSHQSRGVKITNPKHMGVVVLVRNMKVSEKGRGLTELASTSSVAVLFLCSKYGVAAETQRREKQVSK